MTTIKDIEKRLGIERPVRADYQTFEEYQNRMDRYHQVMKHVTKGLPRGVKKTEASQDSPEKSPDPSQDAPTE